jgi:hypothetical protein
LNLRILSKTTIPAAIGLLIVVQSATAEQVVSSSSSANWKGYPCVADLVGHAGTKLAIRLSNQDGNWVLNLQVSGNPESVSRYFDARGLRDEDKLRAAVPEVTLGGMPFHPSDIVLLEVQRSKVDADTTTRFRLEAKHNVVDAAQALSKDGIRFGDLADFTGTIDALAEFRVCSLAALDVADGERIEVDFREEYRLDFEEAFESWLLAQARTDSCGLGSLRDDDVAEMAERAAAAFYPGLTNYMLRGDYVDELVGKVNLARVNGYVKAKDDGCMMAGTLSEMARSLVDTALEGAETLD